MGSKPVEQRMADVERKIQQLQARKQTLAQAIKQQERKDRTRRLIMIGGVMARLGVDTVDKAQALQREVERRPEVQEWVRKVTERAVHELGGS
jgi:hypothetical protein